MVAQTHGMLALSDSAFLRAFDTVAKRPALSRIQHFITLTDDEKPSLCGYGILPDKLTTIHNSTPDPKQLWSQTPRRRVRLLFASRLHPRKQVMVFARLVTRLAREGHDVEGIVAGPDQGDARELLQYMEQDNHRHLLSYVGELDRQGLTEQLIRSTAFVFPAKKEPFGLVLVEAMALGVPVITTNETPLASMLEKHAAAVVVPPLLDPLTDAAHRVICDDDLQKSLSRNGRLLYESNWTNESMTKSLIDVYDRAISDHALARQ